MLERIIRTSSNVGDTVLDCYAGSGTTLLQAARFNRRFIGMDDSPAAQRIFCARANGLDVHPLDQVIQFDTPHTG